MEDNSKQTELDKLDIDELIEETEELIKDETEKQEEDKKEKEPVKEEDKPKKKLPLLLIAQIFLGIIIIAFSILSILESKKKPLVKSGYFLIDKKIVWLSKKKIEESKIKELIKTYDFNLKLAYEFPSIYGVKILSVILYTKFHSKAEIPLDNLYELIKKNIYVKLKKICKNKYIEDVKDYKKKISEIILKITTEILKDNIPDLDINEVKKNFNFAHFIVA